MRLARYIALIVTLAGVALAVPVSTGLASPSVAAQSGFLSANCSTGTVPPNLKSSPSGALAWSDSVTAEGASANIQFEQQTADPTRPFVTSQGNATGVNTGSYVCGAEAAYTSTIFFPNPTSVTLTGNSEWTEGDSNGAIVYIQPYASFEVVARIGGSGSLNVGVPLSLEGEYYLRASAGEPGYMSGKAHYDFALSVSSLPTLTIGDAVDLEGTGGTTTFTFPVSLSSPASSTVSVDYETQDGTASARSDYVLTIGTLTFQTGEQSKLISVSVNGDTSVEPDETFNVVLTSPVNATVAKGTGVGTILNDDFAVDFDWTVPDRFDGQDHNGDGIADYFAPDGPLVIDPGSWRVDFTYTENGVCDSGLVQVWRIDGVEVDLSDPAVVAQDSTSCTFSYGFANEGQYQLELELRTPAGDLVGSQQHEVVVQDWLIVSIGDSVASGEGNPDISGGGPSGWENEQCHRSAAAGPAQAAMDIELADPKTSVTFIHLACSGATIFKGLLGQYGGIIPGKPLPPQLEALQAFVGDREIDALLVSIGANDVHFSDVVQDCFKHSSCDAQKPGSPRGKFERYLTRLPSAYDQLATALNVLPLDPQRVFISEYYDPLHDDAGAICADSVLSDIPVAPHLGLSITAEEATWASTTMLPSLNAGVAAAAANHGWNYVGGILPQFQSHGYCAVDHWVVRYSESVVNAG